jgi:hypothetical protein
MYRESAEVHVVFSDNLSLNVELAATYAVFPIMAVAFVFPDLWNIRSALDVVGKSHGVMKICVECVFPKKNQTQILISKQESLFD